MAATALYVHNFNNDESAAPHDAVLHHLMGSAKFYSFAIGDILAIPFQIRQGGNNWISLFGLLIIVLAVLVVVVYGIRRQERSGSPVGVALICMGLLFAATVTEGRVIFGYGRPAPPATPRSTYWSLSASTWPCWTVPTRRPESSGGCDLDTARVRVDQSAGTGGEPVPVERIGLRVARFVIVAVIVMQFAFAFPNRIRGSRSNYTYQARGCSGAPDDRQAVQQLRGVLPLHLQQRVLHSPAGEDAPAAPPQRVRALRSRARDRANLCTR